MLLKKKGVVMKLSAISASLGFKRRLPELEEGYTWKKDYGCPECGLYPARGLERAPEEDKFELIGYGERMKSASFPQYESDSEPRSERPDWDNQDDDCPIGYHVDYTNDYRKIYVPNNKR